MNLSIINLLCDNMVKGLNDCINSYKYKIGGGKQ